MKMRQVCLLSYLSLPNNMSSNDNTSALAKCNTYHTRAGGEEGGGVSP